MKVFRIEREKYLNSTLLGIGASLSEGFRWNSKNTQLVYTAESRALALLEIAVHLDLSEDLPNDRCFVEIFIPDELEILSLNVQNLPPDWDSKPPSIKTQFIGDEFVRSNAAPVLRVPSSIVKQEYNYLINPRHHDSGKIVVESTKKLEIDKRLGS